MNNLNDTNTGIFKKEWWISLHYKKDKTGEVKNKS